MIAYALSLVLSATPVPKPDAPVRLPAHFSANRLLLRPVTAKGVRLEFVADTGGGLYIKEAAAKRLHLQVQTMSVDGHEAKVVFFPSFKSSAWIPGTAILGGGLPVRAPEPKAKRPFPNSHDDGLLGMAWFEDRVWTIDYPGKKMWLRAPGDLPTVDAAHVVPLHFPTAKDGSRQTNYPRIQVKVDGQTIDLLLDTGAEGRYSRAAMRAAGGRSSVRATSFIDETIFDRWHQKHPDWKVVRKGDLVGAGFSVIRVPKVEVAGYSVGPVWFTERPDDNFRKLMSQWMDQTIDGALGGSALKYFEVTLDYPGAQALFELKTPKS